MEKVNYIVQLNQTLELFNNDKRIKQGHIALYMALFQKWNREYFRKIIWINRWDIMEHAKIKSKTTYHNHLKNLEAWGYIMYFPSYNPTRRSRVQMVVHSPEISTNSVPLTSQKMAISPSKPGQKLTPFLKQINTNKNKQSKPQNEQVVLAYFKNRNWPEIEARKFYAYMKSKNWKHENGSNIKSWKKLAYNFYKNDFKKVETYNTSPISDYLKCREQSHDNKG